MRHRKEVPSQVLSAKVIRTKSTGQPEGYGFIEFAMRMSAAFCIAGWLPVYLSMDVVEEVEEMFNMKLSDEVAKVKKVQDNVCLVLQKLLEANPGLNIDMAQIYGTILGDTGVDGTPLTGGRSTYTICYLSSTLFSKTYALGSNVVVFYLQLQRNIPFIPLGGIEFHHLSIYD
ncbi:hypothetical protein AgCh_001163 [Apium graveolens]